VREATNTPPARPNRFPDAGAYPEPVDPATKRTRQIDCSAAHAERESARGANNTRRVEDGGDPGV
jgi:hypothetical protein